MDQIQLRDFRNTLRRFEQMVAGNLKEMGCCADVSTAQCHIVLELSEGKAMTIVELSRILGLDKSTVSRTIDGLVKSGITERTTHPEDRRYVAVTLTERGTALSRKINEICDDYFAGMFRRIPEELHENAAYYFSIIVEALEEHRSEEKGRKSSCCKSVTVG